MMTQNIVYGACGKRGFAASPACKSRMSQKLLARGCSHLSHRGRRGGPKKFVPSLHRWLCARLRVAAKSPVAAGGCNSGRAQIPVIYDIQPDGSSLGDSPAASLAGRDCQLWQKYIFSLPAAGCPQYVYKRGQNRRGPRRRLRPASRRGRASAGRPRGSTLA